MQSEVSLSSSSSGSILGGVTAAGAMMTYAEMAKAGHCC